MGILQALLALPKLVQQISDLKEEIVKLQIYIAESNLTKYREKVDANVKNLMEATNEDDIVSAVDDLND